MQQRVDGHEAYRDDPAYTAPEMEPGNGEDIQPEPDPAFTGVGAAGLTIGAAGGALAGEVLADDLAEERAESAPMTSDDTE